MSLVLRFAAGSHKGMIREGNEDSGYAGPRLLAVADGMGGAAAGEVASSEVLSSIVELDEDIPGADLLGTLRGAVERANERLRVMVEEDAQLEGMGCTLTAMLWTGQRMGMVHIGDSRAYLLRDGVLAQITADHTWVQRLIDEGRISQEEAETHPQRSLLMRALDGRGQVEPDLSIREVRAGDRYLICSDGLSGPVSHQTLEETLGSYYSPEQTVQELIQLALRGGGPDNITCIVADVLDVGDSDTLSGRLSDVPIVVGAVAEGQAGSPEHLMQTPAGRASGLGRPEAPGRDSTAGGDTAGTHGVEDYDFRKPRSRGRWLRRSLVLLVALGLLGGGAYEGYQWTQQQYYVGAAGSHVAVYRGVSQNLAGISLSSVYRDYPAIDLRYLPVYQRRQVEDTISMDSLGEAADKVDELGAQAAVCRKVAEGAQPSTGSTGRTHAPSPSRSGSAAGPMAVTTAEPVVYVEGGALAPAASTARPGQSPTPGTAPGPTGTHRPSGQPSASSTPGSGPTLSAQEQDMAKACDTP